MKWEEEEGRLGGEWEGVRWEEERQGKIGGRNHNSSFDRRQRPGEGQRLCLGHRVLLPLIRIAIREGLRREQGGEVQRREGVHDREGEGKPGTTGRGCDRDGRCEGYVRMG
jgi:hypothetical protein